MAKTQSSIFGESHPTEDAEIIIVPVPWDVTASYKSGTAKGPSAVIDASHQLDMTTLTHQYPYRHGIAVSPTPDHWMTANNTLRSLAQSIIREWGDDVSVALPKKQTDIMATINKGCGILHHNVRKLISYWKSRDKQVVVLGGDHSVSWGYIHYLASSYPSFGILQIDAHMDLRIAYQRFEHSHASIMHHAWALPNVESITQVGIRDFCESEQQVVAASKQGVKTFFDYALKTHQFTGKTWYQLCQDIIASLPDNVYVTVDIDGLHPSLCPNTGTPVPGGLQFEEVIYLFEQLIHSHKTIIGADLVEVAPGIPSHWDANVGARMLYHLCDLVTLSPHCT